MSGMWNQASNLPEMREQQYSQYSQYSQFADNSIKDSAVVSQSTKSKKKFRLFSKSKNRDTKASNSYAKSGPCYCEECMKEAEQSTNYYLPTNIQSSECYYPKADQPYSGRALSSSQPQLYENSHSQYMTDRIDYIYPPPQQFPCECANCRKNGANLTTELLPLDTQMPLQMMSDSALLCNIL